MLELDDTKVRELLSRQYHDDDEDVRDYIVQILQDKDTYEDPEALVETLLPFWPDETAVRKLVTDLVKLLQSSNGKANEKIKTGTKLQDPVRINRNSEDQPAPSPPGDDSDESSTKSSPSRSKKLTRQERREHRRRRKKSPSAEDMVTTTSTTTTVQLEDESSAWQECQMQGESWGGRGRGGRGAYAGAVNSVHSNIHLTNINVSLENGTELLQQATMDIVKGRRYGLIGRNGVGKSVLLRRLAQKALPGLPHDMRILLVQQQVQGSSKQSALEILVEADEDRARLIAEQDQLEEQLEDISDEEQLVSAAERLGEIAGELDAIGADSAEQRAREILEGLQFSEEMIEGPTSNLSGGWRMRLALARALFVESDLLLFDECTNHLDLYGLNWLIDYLNQESSRDRTLMVVSHDRAFLDAICTDIMVMDHQQLKYHVGNYSDYTRQQQEKASREAQILDATERQRTKAQAFIQKQQSNKKSTDPKKQRQAKMIKDKKIDRMGNYREDGKRYKLKSLKKLSEDHVRLAQKVQVQVDEPVIVMKFPNPAWPPGIKIDDAIVRFEDFGFGYNADAQLLHDITLNLSRGSKVALVGRNGSGKSSLVQLIAGKLQEGVRKGGLWVHPNLKIGHVSQYSVEELEAHASRTVVEYAEEQLGSRAVSARVMASASGNIRQYLGAFGLGGKHAVRQIGKLSGGERMRLCFATVLADEPHLLLLDESTNHVDIETLESMSDALNEYEGSVLMVSHNQGFLSGFCKELWILEDNGRITVTHSDTETFDEIFADYRSSILVSEASSLKNQRKKKADRAKRSTKQRTGTQQSTALL